MITTGFLESNILSESHIVFAQTVESFPLEVERHIQRNCSYFKMKVGKSEVKPATRHIVESSIDKENVVFTYQSTSYVDLKNLVDLHVT